MNDPTDIAEFHKRCGIHVALDESLDDAIRQNPEPGDLEVCKPVPNLGLAVHGRVGQHEACPLDQLEPLRRWTAAGSGVSALVVKPAVVGGLETSLRLASWAQRNKLQVGFAGILPLQKERGCHITSFCSIHA